MTIWKYAIPVEDKWCLYIPKGGKILSVQAQFGEPYLWATVDPSAEREARHFRVYGTGNPIDENGEYIGTFQVSGGKLVFHLFEVTDP